MNNLPKVATVIATPEKTEEALRKRTKSMLSFQIVGQVVFSETMILTTLQYSDGHGSDYEQ